MLHPFKFRCYDKSALLHDCDKLSTFMSRLNKQCKEDHGMGWTPDEYKGMAFEALVEVMINAMPIDKRINITNYQPASVKKHGRDMGIDGYGESHNHNLHTVQIKYRSAVLNELTTKDMISNFVANTLSNPAYKDADMTIFTTAKGLKQRIADEMYHGRVRTLGYNEIGKFINKNPAFWNLFRKEMA